MQVQVKNLIFMSLKLWRWRLARLFLLFVNRNCLVTFGLYQTETLLVIYSSPITVAFNSIPYVVKSGAES